MIGLVRNLLRHTGRDPEYQAKIAEVGQIRDELDQRLQALMKATLDHEGEWFLEVVKRNPECALKVIEGCDTPKGDGG